MADTSTQKTLRDISASEFEAAFASALEKLTDREYSVEVASIQLQGESLQSFDREPAVTRLHVKVTPGKGPDDIPF